MVCRNSNHQIGLFSRSAAIELAPSSGHRILLWFNRTRWHPCIHFQPQHLQHKASVREPLDSHPLSIRAEATDCLRCHPAMPGMLFQLADNRLNIALVQLLATPSFRGFVKSERLPSPPPCSRHAIFQSHGDCPDTRFYSS